MEFDYQVPFGDGETAATVRLRPILAASGHLNSVERVEVLSVDYAWWLLPDEIGRRINSNQQLLCEIDALHRALLKRRGCPRRRTQ